MCDVKIRRIGCCVERCTCIMYILNRTVGANT